MADPAAGPRQLEAPKTWRDRLPELVLALAGGLAVDALSVDVGYGGAVVAAGVGAVLLAANRVRRLPKRAPLVRIASVGALAAAMLAMIVAVLAPESWHGYAVGAAVMFATAAVLIRSDPTQARATLLGVVSMGIGVAISGFAVTIVVEGGSVLDGLAGIGFGVAMIGLGVASLVGGATLLGVASVGLGVAMIGLGVASLVGSTSLLGGVAAIGAGVTMTVVGVVVVASDTLLGVASIGLGVAMLTAGVATLVEGNTVLLGLAVIGLGVTSIGLGAAIFVKGGALFGVASTALGVSTIGLAVANIGLGISILRETTLMGLIRALTRESEDETPRF